MGTKGTKKTSASDAMAASTLERLEPLGEVTSKKMFGGHGLFESGVMFGMVTSKSELRFKVDDSTRARYEAEGSAPMGKMPYWEVPTEVAASDERLHEWAREAIAVAHAAKN